MTTIRPPAITLDGIHCSDCCEPFTIDSAHDCPGSVLDRLGFLERKTEELNGIIKSMVKVVAYSMRDIPVGKAHHSEPPPAPMKKSGR
jgi:hypothetical protein